jgi:Cu(I)/Ag(I) efflux system membrane fusion protein
MEASLRADYEKAIKTLLSLGFGSGELAKKSSEKWLIVDVFAKDLSDIRAREEIAVTAEGSNQVFKGRIVSLPEAVDPTARAAKVRAVVEDRADRLRPNLFARVKIEAGGMGEQVLRVPASAVLDEEDRKIVFTEVGKGKFKRRVVEVGEETGGFYPILAGLSEGEKVVIQGAFQLKAALGISKVGEVE